MAARMCPAPGMFLTTMVGWPEICNAAMNRPDVHEGLQRAAFEAQSSTPQELGAFLKEQLNVWGAVAREAGLQAR